MAARITCARADTHTHTIYATRTLDHTVPSPDPMPPAMFSLSLSLSLSLSRFLFLSLPLSLILCLSLSLSLSHTHALLLDMAARSTSVRPDATCRPSRAEASEGTSKLMRSRQVETVCCRHCVIVWSRVLQCVAGCCSVSRQCVVVSRGTSNRMRARQFFRKSAHLLQCVAVC